MDSEVVFNSEGTPYGAAFTVYNEGNNVPIKIVSITMTEQNGWELVTSDTQIETNKKQIVYQFDGRDMLGGKNEMNLRIEDSECITFDTEIHYGVWTYSTSNFEKALDIEVEFEIENQTSTLAADDAGEVSDRRLDLSAWNISQVEYYDDFAYQVESKITEPN